MEDISCSILNLKRQRDETSEVVEIKEEVTKRQKSYKDIITLLEDQDEVDEPTHDLSSLISTLEQEISDSLSESPCSSSSAQSAHSQPDSSNGSGSEKENVMKHLLEASDDELGLPNTSSVVMDDEQLVGGQLDGGDLFSPLGGEGPWEFEDHEAVNYYSFLQSSQIFL